MTKKEVKDIAQKLNCEALYSGRERTMYIHGINEVDAVKVINQDYQPFTVIVGNHMLKKPHTA